MTLNAGLASRTNIDQTEHNASTAISAAAPAAAGEATPAVIAHGVESDQAAFFAKKPSNFEYLMRAQKLSKRSALELTREFIGLSFGRGKLTLQEYVQYGVYDNKRYTPEQQSRFLSNLTHWPLTHLCCDMTWQATTEDKWLCSHILDRSNIAIPCNLAIIDTSSRKYIGIEKITTGAQLRDFVRVNGLRQFFGKENRGICSFGAFLVEDADDTALHLRGHGPVDYDTLMQKFVGETGYLLQTLQSNHPFFARYTQSLATIRVCILYDGGDVKIPFAVLKLPSGKNIADNFWRPGNLACAIEVASGRILRVRSKDFLGTTEYTAHPETGAAMIGETLPMWDRVLELVRECAPIFAPVRYQSMDIAITPDGPILIEINTGGGFDLPQLATGEGFLTDEVIEFFKSCGYKKF